MEWFKAARGVSPCLFNNLYAEMVTTTALKGYKKGFQLGGILINNLRHADDVNLITTSEDDPQELVIHVQNDSE